MPERALRHLLVVLLAAACANPPPEEVLSALESDAGAGGAACQTHEACPEGQICLFDGSRGRCASPCELTGTCPPTTTEEATEAAGMPDGAPCARDADCGGGTCLPAAAGFPGGHCTTEGCTASAQCQGAGSRCLVGFEGGYCVQGCVDAAGCRAGYTCRVASGGAFCAPGEPSAPPPPDEPVAPPPASEPPSAPPSGEPEPPPPDPSVGASVLEFCGDVRAEDDFYGDGWDRYTVDLEIPAGTHSLQIQAGAASGFGGFERLTGDELDVDFANDFQRVNMLIPGGDAVVAVQLPHLPDVPASKLDGRFTLRFAAQDTPYCPRVVAKTAAGRRFSVNVLLAPGGGVPDAASAPRDAQLQDVLQRAARMYAQAGIEMRVSSYRDLDASQRQRFGILRTETDISELFRTTVAPGDTLDEALTLNLVVVQQILLDDGNVLGVSGGIPGLAGVHGQTGSGVVMTAAVLGDPEVGSQTMAHEIGHFLGLYHTTEVDSVMADVLSDTPECGADAWQDPEGGCPDFPNLMFPYAHPGAEITAQQVFMLHTSPLIR